MLSFKAATNLYQQAISPLNRINNWLPALALRLILAWEFGESGIEKLHGTNWFADVGFPFPFNLLPPDVSWSMATWFEILGAAALILGLATRFFSLSLIILTIVAIASVHWPEHWSNLGELARGYRVIDENNDGFGNYKLPLLFIVMLLPLLMGGAGRASLDYFFKKRTLA